MGWIIGIAKTLSVLCMLGVIYVGFEFIKQLIDKTRLKEDYDKLVEEYKDYTKNTEKKLLKYGTECTKLREEFETFKFNQNQALSELVTVLDQTQNYAENLSRMNYEFFEKIDVISHFLNHESEENTKELVAALEEDILAERKFLEDMEKYRRLRTEFVRQARENQKEEEVSSLIEEYKK